jgi:hypothetical protein
MSQPPNTHSPERRRAEQRPSKVARKFFAGFSGFAVSHIQMTPAFANMSTTPVFPTSYPQGRFPDRSKVANFNAGPSGLPHDVMLQIQHDILNWNNYGMSIMEYVGIIPHSP